VRTVINGFCGSINIIIFTPVKLFIIGAARRQTEHNQKRQNISRQSASVVVAASRRKRGGVQRPRMRSVGIT
jgi:uncharacterized membrane protein